MSLTINISTDDAYTGVLTAINEPAEPADILDDLEETQDHMGLEADNSKGTEVEDGATMDLTDLLQSIKEVSKGVSEKTGNEYLR